jgi:RIO kinase 1
MGQNQDNEQLAALEAFVEQGLIEEVLGTIKSGKEATVYCCRGGPAHNGSLLAAKVYRSRKVRGFSNDAVYNEGRLRQAHRRETRAIVTKSRFGREASFGKWVSEEYETLRALFAAGASVPEPIALADRIIIMEYIGDEEGPAAPLASVTLSRDEAQQIFERLIEDVEIMLSCNRVHGDLSAFNVLVRPGGAPCIIDFPQAVDPRFNFSALTLLERDLENLSRYFERFGAQAHAGRIAHDLWSRFLRSDL